MDRDQLKQRLGDGLSLEQIGATVGRHPSTVAYWLKKHGLVANGHDKHPPKGALPRDELETLVAAGETLAVMAEAFSVSIRTIRYWIERYELPRPHSIRRTEIERAIEEGRRTLFRDCKLAPKSESEVDRGSRRRVSRLRLRRLPGGVAVSPPGSLDEVIRPVAPRRDEIDGSALRRGSEVRAALC